MPTTSARTLIMPVIEDVVYWLLSKSLPPYAPPSASPQVYHTSHIPPSPEPLVSVASLIVPPLEVGPVPFPLHIKLLAHRFIQICAVASDMFIPDNMAAISATTNRLVMPTKQATNAQVLLGNYAYVHQFASDGSIIKLFSQGLIVPMLKKMMYSHLFLLAAKVST
ncbi:hypothetical protein SERLADRAFT_404838 [Serpula lacrymans var. lacrymans S7.9]|uniref:Uncharacterized protein n=1 Tax=Serpula lacrymans var. lacrymans (strain S7.9) TaxID=578457 RepID=F8NFG4_SERL9|nr:uncharacterized protein SERLADRAFT_404838 [Serpula lacrymans var. lacrymans S7.9]EGO30843.1 hypothetical protein SERLADRAFT_404838 [Serpula lacrymans var. lacrymans S7.9]